MWVLVVVLCDGKHINGIFKRNDDSWKLTHPAECFGFHEMLGLWLAMSYGSHNLHVSSIHVKALAKNNTRIPQILNHITNFQNFHEL